MKVYAYNLKPLSGFRNPPRSSTLWGHLAWAIRELEGEGSLLEWIEEHRSALAENSPPPVRLSSAFPQDTLPRPLLPPVGVEETTLRKHMKAIRWLPLGAFKRVLAGGEEALKELVASGELEKMAGAMKDPVKFSRTRVAISRDTGAAAAGLLFEESLSWFAGTLTIYAQTAGSMSPERLQKLLGYVGITGYGGGSSVGNGHFELVGEPREVDLPEASNGNYHLLLGPGLLPREPKGWWRTETYWGRLGNVYAAAETPFKRPYFRIVEGSVLRNPRPALIDLTPAGAPEDNVKVWENLDPLTLPVEVTRG